MNTPTKPSRTRAPSWLCALCLLLAAALAACGEDTTADSADTGATSGTTSDTSGGADGDGTSGATSGTDSDTSGGTSGTDSDTSGGTSGTGDDTSGGTSGTGDDTSGGDTSGGDTSGAVTPPLRDPTAEEVSACADLAEALCTFARGCPALGGDQVDVATCVPALAQECELGVVLPDSHQDAAVVSTCAQTLPQLTCDDVQDITSLEQLCSVPSGERANGEGCARNVQCQILNCNVTAENYPCGTCGPKPPPGNEGDACDPVSGECAQGLVCEPIDQTSGSCQPPPPPKAAGEACDFGDTCVDGYTCTADFINAGTCDPTPAPIEEGQACAFGQACAEGLVCTADFTGDGTCVAPVPADGACTADGAPCVEGYICTSGTCQLPTPVGEGGQCLTDDFQFLPCQAGLSCGLFSGVCEAGADLGEACDPLFGPQCARGECTEAGVCEMPAYGACQ